MEQIQILPHLTSETQRFELNITARFELNTPTFINCWTFSQDLILDVFDFLESSFPELGEDKSGLIWTYTQL